MKKTRLITVLTVAAMLYATCGTAFSVELNLKNLKDAAKKELDQKRGAKKGGSEKESTENKKNSATATSSATAANTEPNSEDDFDWEVNDDFTEITIKKYKGKRKDVVIPSTIQDVPVMKIGSGAFLENETITSVVIPEGVKSIGRNYIIEHEAYAWMNGAFSRCYNLESVVLPADISIGVYSFECCYKLKTITIGENSKLCGCAFDNCDSLKSIDIPKGCTLDPEVFYTCKNLESITLPEDLMVIPERFIIDCEKLTNVNLPTSLKYIGAEAFFGCPFVSVDLPEGLEYLGGEAFHSDTITSVSIPKSLKWISTRTYSILDNLPAKVCIRGNNIETVVIAEGCTPKALRRSRNDDDITDGRQFITGAAISKSIRLQKQLAALKITTVKLDYGRSDDAKALSADLQRYFDISKDDKEGMKFINREINKYY